MFKRHPVFRGLQRPLVFKFVKGRYIYWFGGSLIGGFVIGMAVGAWSMMAGILTVIVLTGGGMGYTAYKQRKGLHTKPEDKNYHIMLPRSLRLKSYDKTKETSF